MRTVCSPRSPWLAYGSLSLALALAVLLSGCAEYRAYRKCGHAGCSGDAQLTREVQGLLRERPALGPPNQVYVTTLDRVVYLSGQVATDLQRESAESAAFEAPGVHHVVDIIGLTYSGR
jgi:osmotically-inducible protein OsmY